MKIIDFIKSSFQEFKKLVQDSIKSAIEISLSPEPVPVVSKE